MDRDDEFAAARGIVTGALLSLGLVFGCALLVHIVATWVGV